MVAVSALVAAVFAVDAAAVASAAASLALVVAVFAFVVAVSALVAAVFAVDAAALALEAAAVAASVADLAFSYACWYSSTVGSLAEAPVAASEARTVMGWLMIAWRMVFPSKLPSTTTLTSPVCWLHSHGTR